MIASRVETDFPFAVCMCIAIRVLIHVRRSRGTLLVLFFCMIWFFKICKCEIHFYLLIRYPFHMNSARSTFNFFLKMRQFYTHNFCVV